MAHTLPDFIMIGAMKTGSTAFAHYLRTHPDLFVPSDTALFRQTRMVPEQIELFDAAPPDKLVGEAFPGYVKFPLIPGIPRRIHAAIPDVRLIYLVREPVDRMVSEYQMTLRGGNEYRPIDTALLTNPSYLFSSMYGMQLEQFLRYFQREQILILRSEDLRADRMATLETVAGFLGIKPFDENPVVSKEFNTAAEKRSILAPWRSAKTTARIAKDEGIRNWGPRSMLITYRKAMARRLSEEQKTLSPGAREHLNRILRVDVERFEDLSGVRVGAS